MSSTLKLLVTGAPGCGKTTLVRRVVESLGESVAMTGFLTEEIRCGGPRIGFRGVTLDGRRFPLAHKETRSKLRVGTYGVELDGLETTGLPALKPGASTELVVLDEIGKMELLSGAFRARVRELLEMDVPLLATVAARGPRCLERLRNDRRVTLLRLHAGCRETTFQDALRRLAAAGIGSEGRR